MDFTFSDDQRAIRDLARGILEKEVTSERLQRREHAGDWRDAALEKTLADAGLLGLVVPTAHGGMGLGMLELCVFLQEIGRVVAPGEFASTMVGALAIAEQGAPERQRDVLMPLAAGQTTLALALVDARSADPARPATAAERVGRGWALTGEKRAVAGAAGARCMLVPAIVGEDAHLFLVDPEAPGVTVASQRLPSGAPIATVTLDGVRLDERDRLGGATAAVRRLHESALVASCAIQVGVSEGALAMTARYVRERVQFGVPIGSFQAVQHRAADCYIDLESMRWTTWRAAWALAEGQPAGRSQSTARACAVAKFWAAEGGARIAAATQHLHGGIGVDLDYPIHRYFLRSKALELGLGGAMPHLAHLGRDLARSGPAELA